ncbi:unnamed protein product [Schistosoma rodhaini]|nr:unnamed protein product [Schistosoma rodhaini]
MIFFPETDVYNDPLPLSYASCLSRISIAFTSRPHPSVYFDNPEVKFEDLTFTKFIRYIVKKLLWLFDNLILKPYEMEIKQHNTSQMYKFRLPENKKSNPLKNNTTQKN